MNELKIGDRVTPRYHVGSGSGEIVALDDEVALVSWDLDTGIPREQDVNALELDAELPDAKFALAKALDYKRQRDDLLRQSWEIADQVAHYRLIALRERAKSRDLEARLGAAGERMLDLDAEAEVAAGSVIERMLGLNAQIDEARGLLRQARDYLDTGRDPELESKIDDFLLSS